MCKNLIKLLLLLSMLVALPSRAKDAAHYYFRTVDIRNGLSQNSVNQIFQDKKGFMWFGTKDGLNRYDGLSFRVYNKENSNLDVTSSLSSTKTPQAISGSAPTQESLSMTPSWIPSPPSTR